MTDEPLNAGERRAVEELKRRLQQRLGARLEGFRLFGSRARGEAEAGSDIDLAVLVRDLTPGEKRELLDLVAEVELEFLEPLAALVMSAAEFAGLLRRERRLARDIRDEGIEL